MNIHLHIYRDIHVCMYAYMIYVLYNIYIDNTHVYCIYIVYTYMSMYIYICNINIQSSRSSVWSFLSFLTGLLWRFVVLASSKRHQRRTKISQFMTTNLYKNLQVQLYPPQKLPFSGSKSLVFGRCSFFVGLFWEFHLRTFTCNSGRVSRTELAPRNFRP